MHLCNKTFYSIFILFSLNLPAYYEININYESGFEYESQKKLLIDLQKESSKRSIENLIKNQDWIKEYSLVFKPLSKEIFISIKNREPLFILNKEHFYDRNLKKFTFDKSRKKIILVKGDINDIEDILNIIDLVQLNNLIEFKIDRIDYSFVNGWDVKTDTALIRFGKNISDQRIKIFLDTVNYIYENRKIPSIIDMRYKDGVALSYGK
jgi:hypothetical protein